MYMGIGPNLFLLFGIVPAESKLLTMASSGQISRKDCTHSCIGKMAMNLGWCVACCVPAGSAVG